MSQRPENPYLVHPSPLIERGGVLVLEGRPSVPVRVMSPARELLMFALVAGAILVAKGAW